MNPKSYLKIVGVILFVLAVLGFVGGLIGPTPEQSIFGSVWFFNSAENWVYLIVGVVGFILAFTLSDRNQKIVAVILGLIFIVLGLYSLTGRTEFWGLHLENPMDTALYLVLGVWGLLAAAVKERRQEHLPM